jgi:hypothetical protein
MFMEKEELKLFANKMISWLKDSNICSSQGAVYSWLNPEKEGYIYPEIIGYYIKLFSYLYLKNGDDEFLIRAKKSADYLSQNLDDNGSVGREGHQYVFDTAIGVSGLISLSKVTILTLEQTNALHQMSEFIYNTLSQENVVLKEGKAIIDNDRWSLSYGSLLIKNAMALHEASDFFKNEKYKELSDEMVSKIINNSFQEGYFTINSKRNEVYTHPHCYATEGIIFLISRGYTQYLPLLTKSATWLAQHQNEDGSMKNWFFKHNVDIEKQGDASSQAIRIWLFADKDRFSGNIKRATTFLQSLQTEDGGIAYNVNSQNEKSQDINSWVTMFSLQAALWQIHEPDAEWIV